MREDKTMAIKNKTYRNFIIVMNKIIAKGYDEKTAEDLAHKVFDNYYADKGRGDRSVEWFIGQILTKEAHDIEQKYMTSSASSAPAADEYEFERVEPCYTGGGVYVFTGKLTNGNYFISNAASADDSWAVIVDADPDEDPEESCFEEWQTAHLVEDVESPDAFIVPMLEWVKANEPDGNYQMDDMGRLMEAFCDSSESDADELSADDIELEPINQIVQVFSVGGGYYVDITVTEDWLGNGLVRQAWLYHNSIGIKEMLFGYLIKDIDFDEFCEILKGNLYDGNCYIDGYRETYMDSFKVYEEWKERA